MEKSLENILVFVTNIKTETDKQKIMSPLDKNPAVLEWNIDQEDIDCVLRIVSETLSEEQIITLLNLHDFECKPLQ
ncbi:hypothetical protein [Flavobacterium restrictum]|uniref:Uncharacterized protein n=1 Tax=Flavobacterium restrictum TaxID=2594428 RepID=A0A553E963_9FLAO|nr:hypothetical protein [Flavobacterium restrictum]TRX41451.1 hypothetical protein FNW21_04980 [Flavobacterium restrictum]